MKSLCCVGIIFLIVAWMISAEEITMTNTNIMSLGTRAAGLIETYNTVPSAMLVNVSAKTDTTKITPAELYYAMVQWLGYYNIHREAPDSIRITSGVEAPPAPVKFESGDIVIYSEEILGVCEKSVEFIGGYQRLPNFVRVADGNKIPPEMWLYAMAKMIASYASDGTFPARITCIAVETPHSWTDQVSYSDSTTREYAWSRTLNVYYESQPDSYTCGPTSLKMIMAYYGKWYSISTISRYMANIGDSPYYDGVAQSTIIAAAKYYGFTSAYRATGWTALKNAIASGKPVVAHIQIKANTYPIIYGGGAAYVKYTGGHYVTVVGLQADSNGKVLYVVCHDPSKYAYIKYSGLSFQTAWTEKSQAILVLK